LGNWDVGDSSLSSEFPQVLKAGTEIQQFAGISAEGTLYRRTVSKLAEGAGRGVSATYRNPRELLEKYFTNGRNCV
jgi:hypothetical protein